MLPQGDDVVELLPGFEPVSPPEVEVVFVVLFLDVLEEDVFEEEVPEVEVFEFGGAALLPSLLAGPDAAAIRLHSKSQPALSFPLPTPASHSSPGSTWPSQHRLPGATPQSAGQETWSALFDTSQVSPSSVTPLPQPDGSSG